MVFYAKDLFLNILLSKSIFYCLKNWNMMENILMTGENLPDIKN